jgi:hypothetical protein
MDQEKDANPIAEIFDEMFTLMQDLETRSVAVLEYLQEQGGVTDEKLAPYLDRAAAAADVRWRAARARMEHLLAPKPKSSTEVGKDEKKGASQPSAKGKEDEGGKAKTQCGSKEVGKELASAQPGTHDAADSKNEKSQDAKPPADAKAEPKKVSSEEQNKEPNAKEAESQAAALAGEKHSDAQKTDGDKNQSSKSDDGKSGNKSSDEEKAQTQKASK